MTKFENEFLECLNNAHISMDSLNFEEPWDNSEFNLEENLNFDWSLDDMSNNWEFKLDGVEEFLNSFDTDLTLNNFNFDNFEVWNNEENNIFS